MGRDGEEVTGRDEGPRRRRGPGDLVEVVINVVVGSN